MESTTEIVDYLSTVRRSPVYGMPYRLEDWLGDLTYDLDGKIISAKSAKMMYFLKATSDDEMNTQIVVSCLPFCYQCWNSTVVLLSRLVAV